MRCSSTQRHAPGSRPAAPADVSPIQHADDAFVPRQSCLTNSFSSNDSIITRCPFCDVSLAWHAASASAHERPPSNARKHSVAGSWCGASQCEYTRGLCVGRALHPFGHELLAVSREPPYIVKPSIVWSSPSTTRPASQPIVTVSPSPGTDAGDQLSALSHSPVVTGRSHQPLTTSIVFAASATAASRPWNVTTNE